MTFALNAALSALGAYPFGGHGFVDPGAVGYHAHAAELAWPMVVDFMERELQWNSSSV